MNAKAELELMVGLLNEKIFLPSRQLILKTKRREDLGGALVFMVLTEKTINMLSVTICWGGGADVESACRIVLDKFEKGSDLIRQFVPFTAGSLDELKLKAAAYYG